MHGPEAYASWYAEFASTRKAMASAEVHGWSGGLRVAIAGPPGQLLLVRPPGSRDPTGMTAGNQFHDKQGIPIVCELLEPMYLRRFIAQGGRS